MKQKEMLLVLPVPFRAKGKQLFFESQAGNGLEQWLNNFDSVVVAAPLIPDSLANQNPTMIWRDTNTIANLHRLELIPLPWAYSPRKFFSCYPSVRASLAEVISRCRYLQFAIGSLFGDWAAVAALEAHKQGRAYAIHTDMVNHKVLLQETRNAKLLIWIKARAIAPLMNRYHRHIIKNCALGLWHGDDCCAAYSPLCANSYLIHNIHTKPSDRIGDIEVDQKIEDVLANTAIRICYAGRLTTMKAPIDWVKAINMARNLGVNLQAIWLGDGPLLAEMEATIKQMNLSSYIELRGFEQDRDKLLKKIKESHIMLFTHVTPESPRCLIEALVCGTPIIGYQSKYAEDLVKDFGGGMFVAINDWKQLGEVIATLSRDRQRLSQLIQEAAKNGSRFNDEVVFRERSELIKKYLP
ncbi:MAG TPA: group 1 glycosyl transferase [Cyanobacteria bacterium UBA11149]|nr:group 1 glycosyl transferase [Cyanobacteria bacterium UBA11367]HBE57020.1 group 1 glycosyl transferase [Cyanobacteria bacterium UBA11366]HBK66747.1 group 1 glycosyl transferase [Cyanobacteria bacterium UBA11166]HBR73050.1 group 1 glycosyl transferase [Cyanobacteria bacterium UBA11159]HBS72735.1 group 1 glycosyl transferase [Cyanobacteria bacterium UBA11153]HBW88857.1 group 1 glycosyl transferase [Cyanobacteria bacterium UBA11149]HCA97020.1 group 1 glycosyl transferase [Cyanobacteria bacter